MTNVRCTDPILKIRIFFANRRQKVGIKGDASFVIAPMPVLKTIYKYLLMSLYFFNLFKIYLNVPIGTIYLP